MIKNSIKQLFRTPFKTGLFLVLIMLAGMFFSLGSCLWIINSSTINAYEKNFSTIGTVEQRASSIRQEYDWDAQLKDYKQYQFSEYATILPISLLSFEGANYIQVPEKRSFYGSYAPEYKLVKDDILPINPILIAEISPLEDGIPDESMKVKVNKIIWGDSVYEGAEIWFCNHQQPNPEPLYKDKSYAVVLSNGASWAHGGKYEESGGTVMGTLEYSPWPLSSTQYAPDGSKLPDLVPEDSLEKTSPYFEITEGFYDTEIGIKIQNLIAGNKMIQKSLPVNGTNATILLMPFYNGDAYITEGRDISAEEYVAGDKVCLVSKVFAQNNDLILGSMVHLQLYYTNSSYPARTNYDISGMVGYSSGQVVDANGDLYSVFEDSQYRIMGIYDIAPGASTGKYSMGGNEVIVPMKSIENQDKYNIVRYGPMKGETTSFQIPNGTIEEFMIAWEKYGTDELEITFYDKGYSKLKTGLDNMKHMSQLLLVVGLLMIIFILLFFSHLFITKQKMRTAIERCLGMEKKDCRRSLLIGIVLILLVGGMLGSIAGGILSQSISAKNLNKNYYDTAYSSVADVSIEEISQENQMDLLLIFVISLSSMGLIVLLGTTISVYKINQNLDCEPMKLLSEKNQ